MTFFCFLDTEHLPMAHMEPLDAETFEEAQHQAMHLLKDHRSARAARIYRDTKEVAIVEVQDGRL